MPSDLFLLDPRENRGEAREKGSAVCGTPIVQARNRGTAGSRGGAAENRVPRIGLQGSGGREARKADYFAQLVERRLELRAAMNELDLELYNLTPEYNRLKAEFYAAHEALAFAWGTKDHSAEARAQRRPLYDARMWAGVAWHPVRTEHDNLNRVRAAMAREVLNINMEIEDE